MSLSNVLRILIQFIHKEILLLHKIHHSYESCKKRRDSCKIKINLKYFSNFFS